MTRLIVLACVLGMLEGGDVQADRDQAVRMAIETLSSWLKVAPDAIQLVSVEPVDWPNSSLGCPKPDMAYLPVIVPGFRVRLAVGDRQREVHTGKGRALVCGTEAGTAPPSRSRSITPALAAADRARRHLASALELKPEELTIARIRPWRAAERPCNPPEGTAVDGETFVVELKRGAMTYRYRATAEIAWACK